ncbi:MAG: MFS transporter [Firmicutes bacterium]|nr:MFS transporter [Bacillota bacterium]
MMINKDLEKQIHSDHVTIGRRTYSRSRYAWMLTIISLIGYMFTTFDTAIFSASLPVIAKTFHISSSGISFLLAAVFGVAALTGFIFGPLADRIGRKPTLQIILLITGLFSGLTAFVGSIAQLVGVRMVTGIGMNSTSPANTLISEEAPVKRRGMMMGVMQAGFPLGGALAGTIAAIFLPDWRPLFLIAFAPVLLIFIVSFYIRESPRFLHSRQQRAKHLHSTASKERLAKDHIAHLFSPQYRRQTIVLNLFNFLTPAGVVMIATFITLYAVEIQHFSPAQGAILLAVDSWVALVSQLLIGYLSDHIPPKWILSISTAIAALTPVLLLNAHGSYTMDLIAMAIYGFFGNGVYGAIFRYTSESYPTRLRGTGIFFAQADANLMFVLLPLLAGWLFAHNLPQVLLYIVAVAQIGAGITMALGKNILPQQPLEVLSQEK